MAFSSLISIRERFVRQRCAIDEAVAAHDVFSKRTYHSVIHRRSRKIELVRQRVGLEKVRPARGQHRADGRLAARDAAGKAYPQHSGVVKHRSCESVVEHGWVRGPRQYKRATVAGSAGRYLHEDTEDTEDTEKPK